MAAAKTVRFDLEDFEVCTEAMDQIRDSAEGVGELESARVIVNREDGTKDYTLVFEGGRWQLEKEI